MRRRRRFSPRGASPWAPGRPWLRVSGLPLQRLQVPFRYGTIHLITLALAVLTISLLINFIGQVMQSARLEAQRVALVAEVEQIAVANRQILGAVEYAESDVNVERVAREQLGMAREGDIVVLPQIALGEAALPLAPPLAAVEPVPVVPNWEAWWVALFPPLTPK